MVQAGSKACEATLEATDWSYPLLSDPKGHSANTSLVSPEGLLTMFQVVSELMEGMKGTQYNGERKRKYFSLFR